MMTFKDYLVSTNTKKDHDEVISTMPQYPTGFMYLDYMTGAYLNVYDEEESPLWTYHNTGISCGSVNTIIAKSQGGKTTLAIKMAINIIEAYVNQWLYLRVTQSARATLGMKKKDVLGGLGCPVVQIADTEKTLPADYAKKIAQYTNAMTRDHIAITQITTDKDLIRLIEKHIKFKCATMERVMMPMLDMFGKPIYDYPPTALIIDSASQLLMEDCDDISEAKKGESLMDLYDNATKNTSGARRAKYITALYSQMVNYAKRYNILIFSINHINKLLPVNGIPVKQYRGLNASETIGGGERAIYLSANILRLDVIKSIGYGTSTSLDLGDGVTGFVAKAKWIKSKSNSLNNTCQLVYTNRAGYDPLLSNLYEGSVNKDLLSAGRNFYVRGYENLKFTLKNARDVFAEHPELITAYYDQLTGDCARFLDNPDHAFSENMKLLQAVREDAQEEYGHDSDAHDMDDIFEQMINAA